MNPTRPVVLGTRGSRLALTQAEVCAQRLRATGLAVEVRVVKTTSEHHPDLPLSVIDQRDVFTRQLDEALLSAEISLAVHSLKDVPTEIPEGIVLARAGLIRLGLDVPHTVMMPEIMLPAVGQGALAVATLEVHPLRGIIRETFNHEPTEASVRAERAMLDALEGGCRVPVGALGRAVDDEIWLEGMVASVDGAILYRGEAVGKEPIEVGSRLAWDLLERGASVVLDELREVRR